MSPERFDHLLSMVAPIITNQDTRFRKAIKAVVWLAITLHFLASGETQQSLSFAYCIGRSTLSRILKETCDTIYTALAEVYLRPLSTQHDWNKISHDFEEIWNLPHVLGAI